MASEKRVFFKKLDDTDNKKKVERRCLMCGIDISHRTKDVKFCCPACKAEYKQRADYLKDAKPEKPKIKYSQDFFNDAAQVYYSNPIKRKD